LPSPARRAPLVEFNRRSACCKRWSSVLLVERSPYAVQRPSGIQSPPSAQPRLGFIRSSTWLSSRVRRQRLLVPFPDRAPPTGFWAPAAPVG
jgi:hypothetical protein